MDSNPKRNRDTPTPDGSLVFPNNPSSIADSMEIEEYDASPSARATPMAVEETTTDDEKKQLRPSSSSRQNSGDEERDGRSPVERKCITSYRPRHYSEGEGQDDYAAIKRRSSYKSYRSFSVEKDPIDAYGFVQLDVLIGETSEDKKEWREIARWIKYEEDLEEGSDRLGKPHIAPLSFHYLVKLSHLIERNSVLLLDLEETDISEITKRIAEHLLNQGLIQAHEVAPLMKDLMLQHRRVEETERTWFGSRLAQDGAYNEGPYRRSLTNANEAPIFTERRPSIVPKRIQQMMSFSSRSLSLRSGSITEDTARHVGSPRKSVTGSMSNESLKFLQQRRQSIKHFPVGAETTMIMVRGEHHHKKGAFVFVRLPEATLMSDITEFPVATRVLIIFLAPSGKEDDFVELGRSVGTLMSNKKFYDLAISASTPKDLVNAINNFLDETIVLPPGDWYNSNFYDLFPIHVLQNKSNMIKLRNLRHQEKVAMKHGADSFANKAILDVVPEVGKIESTATGVIPGPFEKTGKPFGGLINDIKRRYPLYWSDITTGLNFQSLAACVFLYFASVAHNVTFGGILNEKTEGNIGVTETLLAASFSGMVFAAFSGQPLLCIAPTGPLLVFDEILYKFLQRHDIEFLPARTWISLWVVLIGLVVLFFEGSRFVSFFTRFTQETFACLISVIFVYESFQSLSHTYKDHPLVPDKNSSLPAFFHSQDVLASSLKNETATAVARKNEPNTALLCTFLMLGTFYIAITLKHFRTSILFGNRIRNFLSDFAVPISIFVMVSFDYWAGDVYTIKITVPPGLQPTRPNERGWLISPFGIRKPFDPWVPLFMAVPGVLVFILVFMTVEICELIIVKKPKVDKGCGFHLDPLILVFINVVNAFFGSCWVSCATLKALAHLAALTVYSKNEPPGQPPKIIMVLEQRVSAFVMSIFLGLSILMAPALQLVSMAVLFGVFLYMGISSLNGNQLFDRIILFFIPVDSHPQVEYVRRVPTWKIHMYTLIQIGLLAVLWGVKSIKQIALTFPFVLMLLIPIRLNLNRIFTENELDALDGDPKPPAAVVEDRKDSIKAEKV